MRGTQSVFPIICELVMVMVFPIKSQRIGLMAGKANPQYQNQL